MLVASVRPAAAAPAPERLLVVIDQGSLQAPDCDAVSAVVGALAVAAPADALEVVVASGGDAVRPSPTQSAVRAALCGSTAFLDRPSAALSASEAFEILRKNEAVRDAVIRRTCGATPAAGCGAGVAAGAEALARDLRERSDAFATTLERLAIESDPAGAMMLISAGPPTPDLSRAILRRVGRAAAGARLRTTVLVVDSRSPGALARAQRRALSALRDALRGSSVPLGDRAAVSRAVDELLGARAASTPPARHAPTPPVHADEIVRRAAAHVAEFARQAVVILATERYEQQIKSRAGSFGLSGSTRMGITRGRRTLESEVALVQVLDGSLWMIARDVLAVDGRAVAERPSIAASMPTDSLDAALRYLKETADSGARFNIGDIRRNLNTPTLALLVLLDAFRHRFDFRVTDTDDGGATILEFEERATPTLFQVNDLPAPSGGRLWVDRASGAVRRTELVLASDRPASRATVTVDYEHVPEVAAWMPIRMTEKYEEPGKRESDWIECTAIYSRFRRFTVTTKIR
jgi:hypothetical protein